ncbi:Aromatic amino acid aminotransferase C56E4.03 [Verticillium dahliae VDG1]|nr:Aromatic amino acid aminotransferase C56E4.03 [Verticillium dahliae VDG1]
MLQALGPYLRVSFLFFADMMLTVLMTERFHITFSPFVNTYFNPLATHWYRRYGRFMRHIILEIDMTRLGFGPDRQAYKLRAGNMNLDTLIQMFVDVQLRRQDESTMSSFVLLCRRFYGCRHTVIDHITGLDPCYRIPYCPDTAFSVCNPLLDLAGLVDSIRICGFSNTFTHTLKARPEWSKEGPPSLELPNFLDDDDHVYGEKTEKVRRVRSKASVPVMSPVRKAAELKYRPSMPELRQKVSKMASWLDLRARKRAGETSEDMDKEIF